MNGPNNSRPPRATEPDREILNEANPEFEQIPVAQNAGDMRAAMLASAGLTEDEIMLLSMWLFDGLSQREIGTAIGRPQRTVAFWLRNATKKLQTAGINVASPPKGRRPGEHKMALLPPGTMSRLVFRDQPFGPPVGRWVDAERN